MPGGLDRKRELVGLLQVAAVVLGGLVVFFAMKDRLWSRSTDLAQHYDLAASIARTWVWPGLAPKLGSGMSIYPPLAHYLGALLGLPFGSVLIGMNIVAVMSIFGCYLILGRWIGVGSAPGALLAFTVAGAALIFIRHQVAAEGYEVLGSYFYAQLVGELAFLLFVLWLCRTSLGWGWRLGVSAAVVFASTFLYLIASIEMAMAFVFFEATVTVRRAASERRFALAWAAPMALGAVLLPLLIVASPMYKNMLFIAGLGGEVLLGVFLKWVPHLAVALMAVSLALGLAAPATSRWREGSLLLAVSGGATAAACLVQTGLFVFLKIGSDYAIHKYCFSVVTLLAFASAAGVATLLERWRAAPPTPALTAVLPAAFAAAWTLHLPPHIDPDRLDAFARYQAFERGVMADPTLPAPARGTTVSRNNAFSWPLNYASSMVDLGTPLPVALGSALQAFDPSKPDPAAYAFTDDAGGGYPKDCLASDKRFGAVMLVTTRCSLPALMPANGVVKLADLAVRPRYLGQGWSGKEPTGVWNDGPHAEMSMAFDHPVARVAFAFEGGQYVLPNGRIQHVRLRSGDTTLGEWAFDEKTPAISGKVDIPGSLLAGGRYLHLTFDFPDAMSPLELKNSADPRRLTLFLTSFSAIPYGR